ncbi:MAG: hypothetical protein KH208_04180 [Desulfovibrio sp.]|uniref:hypothetical protein n=1 Tax=Desulfovibrio sp. TaxID=885 RepID=UPI0025C62EA4|nr:hypothetical protein [Desulfovibrio sp.]MBS6829058.1 hypothetical protein [Desulfovibrio sp.]
MASEKPDFSSLLKALPPLILRKNIEKYLDGFISSGYLANLDSQGKGPKAIKAGRTVGYLRENFVAWLESRVIYN